MHIDLINPLVDQRWDDLIARHPRSSIFHTRAWLSTLHETYGYKPVALTPAGAGRQLTSALVSCHVSSWLTGSRLVSVPFADHCEPLASDESEEGMLLSSLSAECDRRRYKYAEIRPLSALQAASNRFRSGPAYCFHELDLAPSSEHLFSALQKSSIQRKIIRAEKEQLTYEKGHSERLLNEFYRLLLITRKRHGLPPQPRSWFTNLIRYMKGQLQIWVAWKGSSGISAILALRHRSTVVYKYGCSDERFHNLGGMPFLFWKLIEDSKASGADSLDFGRSDFENVGLITFKDRFGTKRRTITYYRYSGSLSKCESPHSRVSMMRYIVPHLPNSVIRATGGLLYRHMG